MNKKMDIKFKEVSIRELTKEYKNNDEEGGVIGYGGKLNIRPKYQREFVYDEKPRNAVIETVRQDFPLNLIYWVENDNSNNEFKYEVLDGQQRIISICEFVAGVFSLEIDGNPCYFHTLSKQAQKKIRDYKLMVYVCKGNDDEKLKWFEVINTAGEKLTPQELKNALYTGEWLSHAKRHFSKTGCAAYGIASNYVNGTPIRQDYLETAIKWISNNNIKQYMADHQHDKNAEELWQYFQNVIDWVESTFIKYRKEMKGLPFGELYNKFKDKKFDADKIEKEILELIDDDDVDTVKGIYLYVLNRKEKHLNLRQFDDKLARKCYEKQKGICKSCKNKFKREEMEADHIKPWSKGGKTILENCQMLCETCNREKSSR